MSGGYFNLNLKRSRYSLENVNMKVIQRISTHCMNYVLLPGLIALLCIQNGIFEDLQGVCTRFELNILMFFPPIFNVYNA